jgi:hypothetical protein
VRVEAIADQDTRQCLSDRQELVWYSEVSQAVAGPHGANFLIGGKITACRRRLRFRNSSTFAAGESNRLRLGVSKAQKNTSQLVLLIGRKRPDAFNGLFEQFCHEMIVPATSVENQAWIYMRTLSTNYY